MSLLLSAAMALCCVPVPQTSISPPCEQKLTAACLGHQVDPQCFSLSPSCRQVSLSPEDLQALGNAISVVAQHGNTTLTIPSNQDELATSGTHTVTMVSADGTQTQPV